MRILFFGDVVGSPGRKILRKAIDEYRKGADFIIVNGENAAHGYGITPKVIEEILDMGVDVITTGGHVFDRPQWKEAIERYPQVVVPGNYPGMMKRGFYISSKGVAVMNLHGQVFVNIVFEHPFRVAADMVKRIRDEAGDIPIILDFHGEATSEKVAMGWFLDGKITSVVGTHTHVPTADDRMLPGGTGYITDVGMCGCRDTVIGMDKDAAVARFATGVPHRLSPPEKCKNLVAYGLIIEVSDEGKTTSMRRVEYYG